MLRSRPLHLFVLLLLVATASACTRSTIDDARPDDSGGDTTTTRSEPPTSPPVAEDAIEYCVTLREAPFETRYRAQVTAAAETVERAAEACPDDVTRLADAVALRQAAARVDVDDYPTQIVEDSCGIADDGRFEVRLETTNNADVAISIMGTVRITQGEEVVPGATPASFVTRRIPPGESEVTMVTGTIPANAATSLDGLSCQSNNAGWVDDPDLPGDASQPEPYDEALASDDPAVWFPTVLDIEAQWAREMDESLVAATEDIRSNAYVLLVNDLTAGNLRPAPESIEYEPCTIRSYGERVVLLTYVRTAAGASELTQGVFRRGDDGGWRWLGQAQSLRLGADCDDAITGEGITVIDDA